MTVHSCFVDDGNGDRVDLIQENGCAIDRFLLNNLEYPTDLMAGVEAHVFKYADRAQLFFQCQITINIKDPGSECTRPQCAAPTGVAGGAGAGSANIGGGSSAASTGAPTPAPAAANPAFFAFRLRRKRESPIDFDVDDNSVTDVRAGISALEIDDTVNDVPPHLRRSSPTLPNQNFATFTTTSPTSSVCLTATGITFLLLGGVFVVAMVAVVFSFMSMRKQKC
jgi:hypothetical protein